ncbi:MAG: hypothetical protein JXQ72_09100 [Anaerolineae bacterium]|nr:hypothetical protein [Anaerolineae bacterium]
MNTRTTLRILLITGWLVLVLLAVGPVFAQGGGDTDSTTGGTALTTDPQNLDDVAVRLMPLLVGAALIERSIEILFTWLEKTVLDAGSYANRFARWLTGLIQVDFKQAWESINNLTNAMLAHKTDSPISFAGNPASANPEDWPLAMLEDKLVQAKQTLENAQGVVEKLLDSPDYIARKKMMIAWLSMGFGILLAFVADMRLFKPLGVDVTNWFEDPFGVLDVIMAGALMGLGSDYVHQVIGVLIKGKGALSRVGGGSGETGALFDPEQVRLLAQQAILNELSTQMQQIGVPEQFRDMGGSNPSEPPST